MYYAFILGLFFAFVYFVVLQLEQDAVPTQYTGANSLDVLRVSAYGDSLLLFADESARMSIHKGLFELGDAGGYADESPCERYFNYNKVSSRCTPDIVKNLETIFNKHIDLQSHPDNKKSVSLSPTLSVTPHFVDVPYKLYINKNTIVAASGVPLDVVFGNTDKQTSIYSVLPDVHITTNYDFDMLHGVSDKISALKSVKDLKEAQDQLPQLNNDAVKVSLGGCPAETAEDAFFDVVERVQWCMAAEESCTCGDLTSFSGTELSFNQNQKLLVTLRVNNENQVSNEFDGNAILAVHDAAQDKLVLVPAFTLDKKMKLVRSKTTDTDYIAFVAESNAYPNLCMLPQVKKFRACITAGAVPRFNEKTQQIEQTPVHFKVAVDVSQN